ncbi:hypothetical protein H2202_001864 [Exophiala xenobiotica]|nr:hypothetical protein H2202_001864 [Exophiala xenobiotica]KAK5197939.1 hypothetical protein LTR92_002184 [Exophiala xenobiotica]KAK5210278.1 hypothetical protein LTR41_003946 [Exophiala xenobiotica]KAK5259448.1 hypothetical protein LTR40_005982 [Exophiala xenobiotica]KAK5325660.1 hypothetical protein LTR93_003880 [Exophiala xenobiotica]
MSQPARPLQHNERDPYEFTKSSVVAARVLAMNSGPLVTTTFHIHTSLIRRYSSVLTQRLDNLRRPYIPTEETDSFDSSDSEAVDNTITIPFWQDTFRLFVVWLYQGPDSLLSGLAFTSDPKRWTADLIDLWTFAEDFKVESLKNDIVDTVQHLPFNDDFFKSLIELDWSPSATSQRPCGAVVDYMYDKLAYEITTKSWAHFMSVAETTWAKLMHNPHAFKETTSRILKRLVGQLSLAHELITKGDPADPANRMDCRWHQHATLESFRLCPRYNEEEESTTWTRLSRNEENAQRHRQREAKRTIATWPHQSWVKRREEKARNENDAKQVTESQQPPLQLGWTQEEKTQLQTQEERADIERLQQLEAQKKEEQTQLELWKSMARKA